MALSTVYMRLDALRPAEVNPKTHDLPALVASLETYGFTELPLLDERTGRLVAGHGRREACIWMRANGMARPTDVEMDDDGEWMIPVRRGWSSKDDREANAYIVLSNQTTIAGGWHMKSLAELTEDIVTNAPELIDALGFTADDLDDMMRRIDPETLPMGPADVDWGAGEDDSGYDDPPADVIEKDPAAAAPPPRGTVKTCPNCHHRFEVT